MTIDARRIERILALTQRLTAALKDDIAALERGRPREMRSPSAEVQQLTALYRNEAQSFNSAAANDLPEAARERLGEATAKLREALALHNRILSRVRSCTEGMIRAIAEDVAKKRNAQKPYSKAPATPGGTGALIYNRVV